MDKRTWCKRRLFCCSVMLGLAYLVDITSPLLHWAGPRCVVGLTAALKGCKDGICSKSVCLCVCGGAGEQIFSRALELLLLGWKDGQPTPCMEPPCHPAMALVTVPPISSQSLVDDQLITCRSPPGRLCLISHCQRVANCRSVFQKRTTSNAE